MVYGVNLSTGYFKSDGVDHQQLPTDFHKCVGESQLTTVKRSNLDALDAYDTTSSVFVDKFMVVNYFTCLDDIANDIDDLFTLEDLYVSVLRQAYCRAGCLRAF
jgi:regulator of sigma D